jgi:hypothetical protein
MSNTSRIARYARRYIEKGWRVVPIPSREKAPCLKSWQKLRIVESEVNKYFDDDSNIGILLGEPSDGLVDVDLDCEESINLAPHFLPATDRIHGRRSAQNSHYFYRTKPCAETEKYRDVDGESLVELRSTGLQTVIPPSIHPSGEHLRWAKEGKPARVSPDELSSRVRRLAACTLLARHWPHKGSRNEASLAVAGILLRAGWDEGEASDFIELAARAADDEQYEKRGKAVGETRRKLDKDAHTTGRPRLAELIGTDAVNKLCEWLGINDVPDPASDFSDPGCPRPVLGDAALYGLAGDIVRAIEPETEADPAALLVQTLVAFGSCIGPGSYYEIEAAKQRGNLFCIVVGRSSKSRKGTAWAHIIRIFRRVDPKWAENQILTGLSSGEGLIWSVRDQDVKKSNVNDQSEDVVVSVLDKRVLVLQSEFASVLRVQRREGNTLSAILRNAWDSGTMGILTKNSPVKATEGHVSIIGHITEDELQKELTAKDEANGYANRFLFACASRSKSLPLGGDVNEQTIDELVQRLTEARRFAMNIGKMRFSTNATKLWIERYDRLSREIPGMLGAITSRSEAQVLRLSLLYALLSCSRAIKTVHLRAALSLWKYCQKSARYIFGGTLGDKIADRILVALKTKPKGLSRNDIRELFKRNLEEDRIDRALKFLAQHRLARSAKESTAGRPKEMWYAT